MTLLLTTTSTTGSTTKNDSSTCAGTNDDDDTGNSKITLKAAVLACWPNETVLDVIRLIKQGSIEVASSSSSSSTTTTKAIADMHDHHHDIVWTIVRQHGKRIVLPNQYLRRRNRRINEDNSCCQHNNSTNLSHSYDIRMVPSYPIVIAMYKPCGYIVTTAKMTSTAATSTTPTDDNPNNHRHTEENDTLESSSSTSTPISASVYDLLTMSTRHPNDHTISSSSSSYSASPSTHTIDPNTMIIPPYWSQQLRAVGRLDKHTEGLLLFTNQGRWNIALTNPIPIPTATFMSSTTSSTTTTTIWKRYRCVLQNPATLQDLQDWIDGGIPFRHFQSTHGRAYSRPALAAQFVTPHDAVSVHHLMDDDKNQNNTTTTTADSDDYTRRIVDVTIGEGKYRQVRRCWESLSNNKVIHLQRLSFGPIELFVPPPPPQSTQQSPENDCTNNSTTHQSTSLPLLQPGQWRSLSTTELQTLEHYVHLWYRHNPNYQTTKVNDASNNNIS